MIDKFKRVAICLIAVALISGSWPPKARAVVLADDAIIIAGVACVLVSAGVTFWAFSDTDAQDYLARQLQDYIDSAVGYGASLQDWLDLDDGEPPFEVVEAGKVFFTSLIANRILAFCRWYQQRSDIGSGSSSGGSTVTVASYDGDIWGNFIGSFYSEADDGIIKITFDGFADTYTAPTYGYGQICITIPILEPNQSIRVSMLDNISPTSAAWNWRARVTSAPEFGAIYTDRLDGASVYVGSLPKILGLYVQPSQTAISGDLFLDVSAAVSSGIIAQPVDRVRIIPNTVVSFPADLAIGESLDVPVNASVEAGEDASTAAQAIYDVITSAEGLSSVATDVPSWGWLQDILDAIYQAIISIPSVIRSIPQAISEALTPDYTDIEDYSLDITSVFPFCIPWDIARLLNMFAAEPVTPVIHYDFPLPDAIGGGTVPIDLDFSEFNDLAQLTRHMLLILYAAGLLLNTRKIIKW